MLPCMNNGHFKGGLLVAGSNNGGDLHKIGSSPTDTADMHAASVS